MSLKESIKSHDVYKIKIKTIPTNSATINLSWKNLKLEIGKIEITPNMMPFSKSFDIGTIINLDVIPKTGFYLKKWNNGRNGNNIGFKVIKDTSIVANMEEGDNSNMKNPGYFSSVFKKKSKLTDEEITWLRDNVLPKK